MEHKQFTQAAEDLLFAEDFQKLKKLLEFREPNIWHILGIARKETRMSSFLAWLVNPQAKHSFGDELLKGLLIRALQTETGRRESLTPVDILITDLSEVQVKTEHYLGSRRCDIIVFSPDKGETQKDGFLCIIENKIDAKESKDQTKDYFEASLVAFPPSQYPHRVYIYLSPDGHPSQSDGFIPLSYQEILQEVNDFWNRQQLTETEKFLLRQFEENVSRGIAMDPKTLDLAQAIYDRHREVFDFIFENVEREVIQGTDTIQPDRKWDGKSRFFNIGEMASSGYRWTDCQSYHFICAGGGKLYRNWMEQLRVGDVIYAYVSGHGYVGMGTIIQKAVPFREARLGDGQLLSQMPLDGKYNESEDKDVADWIAFVNWQHSVDKSLAVREEPITRQTTSRVFDHRKDVIEKVKVELAKRAP